MKIEEIYAIKPNPLGWRILPNGNLVKLGDNVKLGDGVTFGDDVELGDNVTVGRGTTFGDGAMVGNNAKIGNWVRIGAWNRFCNNVEIGDYGIFGNDVVLYDDTILANCVTFGNGVKLGNRVKLCKGVTLGDNVKLDDDETSEKLNLQAIEEYRRLGKKHIFCKWVDKDRTSPFHGNIKYNVGDEIISFDAVVSDIQCAAGLHVFRIGFRPEWAGLCQPNHDLIKIDVEVNSEDICFAGVADMNQKLRVRKLKVLN